MNDKQQYHPGATVKVIPAALPPAPTGPSFFATLAARPGWVRFELPPMATPNPKGT